MIERWQSPGDALWRARGVGLASLCSEKTFGTGPTLQSRAFFIVCLVCKASKFITKVDDRSGAYAIEETNFQEGSILKVLCVCLRVFRRACDSH